MKFWQSKQQTNNNFCSNPPKFGKTSIDLHLRFKNFFLAYLPLQSNSYRLQMMARIPSMKTCTFRCMFYKKHKQQSYQNIVEKKTAKGIVQTSENMYLLWKYSTGLHTCSVYFFACFCFISLPMNSVFLCNQFYTLGLYFCRKIFTFVHRGQRAWPILRRT